MPHAHHSSHTICLHLNGLDHFSSASPIPSPLPACYCQTACGVEGGTQQAQRDGVSFHPGPQQMPHLTAPHRCLRALDSGRTRNRASACPPPSLAPPSPPHPHHWTPPRRRACCARNREFKIPHSLFHPPGPPSCQRAPLSLLFHLFSRCRGQSELRQCSSTV